MKLIKLLILSIFLTGVVPLSDLGSLQAESSEQQKKKRKKKKKTSKKSSSKKKKKKKSSKQSSSKKKKKKKKKKKTGDGDASSEAKILRLRLLNLHPAQKNQTDQIQLPMQTSYLLLPVS